MKRIERLEPIHRSHLPILVEWFEDSEVRKRMDGMLPLEEWYDNTSGSENYYAWLTYQGVQPVGAVIVELEDDTAYIGLMTAPSLRSQGYGKAMVREVMTRPELQSATKWVASIEEDNKPCLACFKSLGYVTEEKEADEDGFFNFVYQR